MREKKILLVYKCDGDVPSWGLPGGGVEFAEREEDALAREVLDETGYEVVGRAEKIREYPIGRSHRRIVFLAFVDERRQQEIQEVEEILKAEWFTLDEIMDMPHVPYREADRNVVVPDVIKENHRDYILTVLGEMGWLHKFGLTEATADDLYETDANDVDMVHSRT